ncbi:hypothetical protein Lepto7376_3228 [[Leptolyngbya] sp. PCC 7376]|uniref:DUF4231 domain-containing protein n=1 Tax=[Leptolyngbya] sp. PCC 7376 TaxID=111781 RepID=UPI00029F24EB|nr:DUF4231 domain-containing protein [[Leptolyngbya] sp. PCC 7376]AFY39456.1 hypothetical protein Lepto7376_3228 [[Leptolyngbya] sp. PCC 7376]
MPHYLQEPLETVIDQLDLTAREKHFIKGRWLDQLIYADKRASRDQKKYFRLRMITIVGGVIVPALVSLNNIENTRIRNAISWITFVTSLTVAVSAAVEEFFQYGESYRRFRNTAEGMKIEGWSFFQLSGPYEDAASHAKAYKTFASHVEKIIQKDVEGYNAEMMKKQEDQEDEDDVKTVRKSVQTIEKTEKTLDDADVPVETTTVVQTETTEITTPQSEAPAVAEVVESTTPETKESSEPVEKAPTATATETPPADDTEKA